MNALTPLAVSHADVLRHLAAHAGDDHVAIAKATGRIGSNVKRDMPRLMADGLVDAANTLTPNGHQALAALDRANKDDRRARHVIFLRHDEIVPDPSNFRRRADPAKLRELADSIMHIGMKQRPSVRRQPNAEGKHQLTMGWRRWLAWGLLIKDGGYPASLELPCWIDDAPSDAERAEGSLVENLQREDLNHAEIGEGFEALAVQHGRTNREIADRCGKSIEFVQQHRRLVKLPVDVMDQVRRGALPLHDALKMIAEPKATLSKTAVNPSPVPQATELPPVQELALIELAWKTNNDPVTHDDRGQWANVSGYGYLSEPWRALRDAGLILEDMPRIFGRVCCVGRPSPAGVEWLRSRFPDHLLEVDLREARKRIGRLDREAGAGVDEGYYTEVLNDRIGMQNIRHAREAWETPKPAWVLTLAEIAHKAAHAAAGGRGGAGAVARSAGSGEFDDEALRRLSFAYLIESEHQAGRTLYRMNANGRALLDRLLGADPATEREPLLKAALAAGFDRGAADDAYNSGRYLTAWLNDRRAAETENHLSAAESPPAPPKGMTLASVFKEPETGQSVFVLAVGDLVSIGGAASAYRIIEPADGQEIDGIIRPAFIAQQVSLKTGKEVGRPRHITLAAIVGLVSSEEEPDEEEEFSPALQRLAGVRS